MPNNIPELSPLGALQKVKDKIQELLVNTAQEPTRAILTEVRQGVDAAEAALVATKFGTTTLRELAAKWDLSARLSPSILYLSGEVGKLGVGIGLGGHYYSSLRNGTLPENIMDIPGLEVEAAFRDDEGNFVIPPQTPEDLVPTDPDLFPYIPLNALDKILTAISK